MPIEKIESSDSKDVIYQQLALRMMYLGKKCEAQDNNTISRVELGDIYQSIFPKLYSDKIRMEYLTAWVEVDKSVLDQQVPENFPDCKEDILFKDYLLAYRVKGEKALLFIGHRDSGYSRNNPTSSNELYCFVDEFKNDTISNIYTQDSSIQEKLTEYTDPETLENINKMLKSEIVEYMRIWGYDEKMTADKNSPNFSTATKDELLNYLSTIKG